MPNQQIILSRVLPFATYILFLGLGEYLTPLLNSVGVDSKWLYAIKILMVLAALLYFWRDYSELTVRPKVWPLIYAAIAGLLVFLVWILPYPSWATLGVNPMYDEGSSAAFLWLSIRILGAALIVPIMEELFWRSFVMRWIDNKNFLSISPENVSLYALFTSACLFALEHHLWLAGLFAGLVYAWLYKTCKNLWVPIFAHAVTNGLLAAWVVWTGHWQYW